jgi:hypothetical protein
LVTTGPAAYSHDATVLPPRPAGADYVFGMPDLTTMPATATNDWMSAAYPGLIVTLPGT